MWRIPLIDTSRWSFENRVAVVAGIHDRRARGDRGKILRDLPAERLERRPRAALTRREQPPGVVFRRCGDDDGADEVDRALPLVEGIRVALGDHADLGHRPLVEPQPLGDLAIAQAALIDPLERVRQRENLVLVTRIHLRIETEECHRIYFSPWAAGQ